MTEKENKDSFKVKTGNVQEINIVGTVLLSFAIPHCLEVTVQPCELCHMAFQFKLHATWSPLGNFFELPTLKMSAWIWTDRSQPGRYSSWQCVCTATVANANCNACWVADIFVLFCLLHIIGPQHGVYLRRNYKVLVVNHITCPISSFTLPILHWKVKNLKSLALNPMTIHHWIGFCNVWNAGSAV